jgi:hypothetical protein
VVGERSFQANLRKYGGNLQVQSAVRRRVGPSAVSRRPEGRRFFPNPILLET